MWPRFGIKVGNSTLCIAYVRAHGKIEVIANKQGDRVSQACLLWDGADEIECGLTAKQKMATRPKQAVANSLQFLLPSEVLSGEKLKTAIKELPCEYNENNHKFQLKYTQNADDDNNKTVVRELSAFDVHVQLFRAELELARQYHTDENQKPILVMSIPSYYPNKAWVSLAAAAEEAGFHVAQVISEPTAAVLAYRLGESNSTGYTKYVVTIKSGNLYTHFDIYGVRDGFYTLLDSHGPFSFGGQNYTEALVQHICEEFERKYKLHPNESRRSMAKIRLAAANCKHILTTLASTQIYIDSLIDGIDFNMQMSRARFEGLSQAVTNNFVQTLSDCIERTIQKCPDVTHLDAIVMLGGTMQIPRLQIAIALKYPDTNLCVDFPADEVVAVGCARQATYLAEPLDKDLEANEMGVFAEEELIIWHGDDENNSQILLEKGALLPSKVYLKLKRNETTIENIDIFKLRSGVDIQDVCLKGAAPADGDVFHIEAELDWKDEEDNNQTTTTIITSTTTTAITPVIRLRCV